MADMVDLAQEYNERAYSRFEAEIAKRAAIPAGKSGDCDICGEWSGRLINGACAPCRDKHNLE